MTASDIKFCKDCKWAERTWFGGVKSFAKCFHDDAREIRERDAYMVIGEKAMNYNFCSTTRLYGPCGPDAKLFEPKE